MLTLDEGIIATRFARSVVEGVVKNQKPQKIDLSSNFKKKLGVFVTLHNHPSHTLRGCIGIPLPIMTLENAIKEAGRSVTHDPRFLPLRKDELDKIIVEITILTEPKVIDIDNPREYLKKIKIGRDGLIISHLGRSGLLLPQVPVEQGWGEEEYLTNICLKAGLPPDAWFDKESKISSFTGQIFSELDPCGKIVENKI